MSPTTGHRRLCEPLAGLMPLVWHGVNAGQVGAYISLPVAHSDINDKQGTPMGDHERAVDTRWTESGTMLSSAIVLSRVNKSARPKLTSL